LVAELEQNYEQHLGRLPSVAQECLKMRFLLVFWLLLTTTSVFAEGPRDVVERLYRSHRKIQVLSDTMKQYRSTFTPGFLKIYDAALAKGPDDGDFIDYDFLVNSQESWSDYEVGAARQQGRDAVVPVKLWMGPVGKGKDPSLPIYQAEVHLTDLGQGFQVSDIRHFPHDTKYSDGKVVTQPGHSVREGLAEIAKAHAPAKK
jgi:hypothetical protein